MRFAARRRSNLVSNFISCFNLFRTLPATISEKKEKMENRVFLFPHGHKISL